jgi:STE24 endopeptidase
VLIVVLLVYARTGARFVRESAAGRIGTGMLLAMLGFAMVWLAQLPFSVLELWWQRRHHISKQSYAEVIFGGWLGLGAEFVFVSLAVVIVMGIAAKLRNLWWIAAVPVFVGLMTLAILLSPYLIPDTHPLRDPGLRADARALARAEGVPGTRVEVQKVHTFTTAPNAEAVGLGGNSRVILWDTLLDGRFPDREVRMVLAHEFGHISRHHLAKSIAWYALFALPGAFLLALATRGRGGMYEPTAIPLALLVFVLLSLAAAPFKAAVTRHMEAEADWVALRTTRAPAAAISGFRRLAITSRAQPQPPGWAHLLLDDHPTIMQRIEMSEAWRAREAR